MGRRMALLLAAGVLLSTGMPVTLGANVNTSDWVTEADLELAAKARDKEVLYCADSPGVDKVADRARHGRESLVAVLGGHNFFLDDLKASTSPEDFSSKLQEHLVPDEASIITSGLPVVLSFLALAFWFVCCWSACCRCCRCCEKTRRVGCCCKSIFGILIFVGLALIIYSLILTVSGHNRLMNGVRSVSCSSAEMMSTSLSGADAPAFIGLLPVLDFFENLSDELRSNDSSLVRDVDELVQATDAIQSASVLSSAVISLLADMMAEAANRDPGSSMGLELQHRCSLCEALAGPLADAEYTLSTGLRAALLDARSEASSQIGWQRRSQLADHIDAAPEPLKQLKDQLARVFGPVIESDLFDQFRSHSDTSLIVLVVVLVGSAFIYWFVSLSSCCCWLLPPKKYQDDCAENLTYKQHRRAPAWCSLCGWYCSICCIWPALFVGGVLLAVSVPLSAVCLTLDAVDGDLLEQVSPGLGLNMTGDAGEQLKAMADSCIAGKGPENPKLMDIIFVRNDTGGRVTLRDQFEESALAPIANVFDRLQSGANEGPDLKSLPEIARLTLMISNNEIDAFIVPTPAFASDSRWGALMSSSEFTDSALNPPLSAAATSSKCEDHVPLAVGGVSAPILYGINTFWLYVNNSFAVVQVGSSCVYQVPDCSAYGPACDQYNDFMDIKAQLVTEPLYRCDILEDSAGRECDPKDMVYTESTGTYTSDCLINKGTLSHAEWVVRRKERNCTLAEFVEYTTQMAARINATMDRLTASVNLTSTTIAVDLRRALNVHIVDRLTTILDGLSCGFLAKFYQGAVLDGFCFTSVPGVLQVAQAFVILGIAVLWVASVAYVMWRVQADNILLQLEPHLVVLGSHRPSGKRPSGTE